MSLQNQAELDLLDLYFTNVTAPHIGDATGIAGGTVGVMAISLHTVALDDTTTSPVTNEAAYSGYARKEVARSTGIWTVAGVTATCDNDAAITYAVSADGPETLVHFGISGYSGSTYLLLNGDLGADLVVNIGITPEFAAQALAITLD